MKDARPGDGAPRRPRATLRLSRQVLAMGRATMLQRPRGVYVHLLMHIMNMNSEQTEDTPSSVEKIMN